MKNFLRNTLSLLLAAGILLAPSFSYGKNKEGSSDIDNDEHDHTSSGVGSKRTKLVNTAGSEVGTAASPLYTSPATSPAVQPVNDNAGSLTVDSPQLPAALAAGGGIKVDGSGTALPVSSTQLPAVLGANAGLKVETCIPNYAVVALQLTCTAAGTASLSVPAGSYRVSIVGGETGRLRYDPATSCAVSPAGTTYGALVVGAQDQAVFGATTVVCCYSATSAALLEFQVCK